MNKLKILKPEDEMKKLFFAALITLAFAVPAFAEVIDFKLAENWVSAPDDGLGGPLVLLWARPRGLGQSGTQFFTPIQVSTSVFSVAPQDLPDLQVAAIPEPSNFAWVVIGVVLCGIVGVRRKTLSDGLKIENHVIGRAEALM